MRRRVCPQSVCTLSPSVLLRPYSTRRGPSGDPQPLVMRTGDAGGQDCEGKGWKERRGGQMKKMTKLYTHGEKEAETHTARARSVGHPLIEQHQWSKRSPTVLYGHHHLLCPRTAPAPRFHIGLRRQHRVCLLTALAKTVSHHLGTSY